MANATVQPDVDFAQQVLAPVQVDNDTKAQAWEAYHNSASLSEFQQKISDLNLPQSAKADLWEGANMRFNGAASAPAAARPAPMETSFLGRAYDAVMNPKTSGYAQANQGVPLPTDENNNPVLNTPDQNSSVVRGAEKGLTSLASGT